MNDFIYKNIRSSKYSYEQVTSIKFNHLILIARMRIPIKEYWRIQQLNKWHEPNGILLLLHAFTRWHAYAHYKNSTFQIHSITIWLLTYAINSAIILIRVLMSSVSLMRQRQNFSIMPLNANGLWHANHALFFQ